MFKAHIANQVIRDFWEREKALPIRPVMEALREKRQGRRTETVAKAITNFLGPEGRPRRGAKAFAEVSKKPTAVQPRKAGSRESPAKSKTDREAVPPHVSETGKPRRKTASTLTAQQSPETADTLARLEARLIARETEIANLEAELAQRTRETADALAHLEKRLLALETDDDRMLDRVMDAHRRQSEAFWKRVRNAVSDIMHVRDDVTVHDILEMLPPELCREAKELRQLINVQTLAERLGVDLGQDGQMDIAVNE